MFFFFYIKKQLYQFTQLLFFITNLVAMVGDQRFFFFYGTPAF
jgi:hypothetical protein